MHQASHNHSGKKHLFIFSSFIVAISAVVFFIYLNHQNQKEARLAESYFEPYLNIYFGSFRGTNEANDDRVTQLKRKAYRYYDSERYKEAIEAFEQLPLESQTDTELFFAGNAYFALGDAAKAKSIFEQLITREHPFVAQSKWYLGLSLLKLKMTDDAKAVFTELAEGGNIYGKQSEEILEFLK